MASSGQRERVRGWMRSRGLRVRGLLFGAVLIAGVVGGHVVTAEPVRLITPVVYGTHLPGLGAPARDLARALKAASEGALVLDLKQPGEGTAPHEILDKVSDGKIDAGFAMASFWAAKLPAASLFSGFPFGPDAKGYQAWFTQGHGRALYQEMYNQAGINVHVIPCAFGGAETGGWFLEEVTSKEDLQGLRMRIFGLGARVMSRLGAVPVIVPGSQIGAAFKAGKIEGAEVYTPAVDQTLRIQDTAKRLYMPGWHQPATVFELLINKDRWAELKPEYQSLIETTCDEMLQQTLSTSANLQAAALAALTNQDGVRVETMPDEVLDALREAWAEIVREEGVRDYFFKEVLEDIETFRTGGRETEANSASPVPAPTQPKTDAVPRPPSTP